MKKSLATACNGCKTLCFASSELSFGELFYAQSVKRIAK